MDKLSRREFLHKIALLGGMAVAGGISTKSSYDTHLPTLDFPLLTAVMISHALYAESPRGNWVANFTQIPRREPHILAQNYQNFVRVVDILESPIDVRVPRNDKLGSVERSDTHYWLDTSRGFRLIHPDVSDRPTNDELDALTVASFTAQQQMIPNELVPSFHTRQLTGMCLFPGETSPRMEMEGTFIDSGLLGKEYSFKFTFNNTHRLAVSGQCSPARRLDGYAGMQKV